MADVPELNKYLIENKVKAMWREKQRVKASPWVILPKSFRSVALPFCPHSANAYCPSDFLPNAALPNVSWS